MKAVGWTKDDGRVQWLGDRIPVENTTLFVQTPEEPDDSEILGYTLEPIRKGKPGTVRTAAFILCGSCDAPISSNGGPRYNAVCLKCVEHLNFTNLIKGK